MTTILETVNGAFEALFYGTGSWLGILILLSICVGLTTSWKYGGILVIPVTILMGIAYLEKDLAWHALILFFTSIFIIFYMVKQHK